MSSQVDRLRRHAAAGLSKAQACDREGCSHKTAVDALKGTDLKWGDKVRGWRPEGTTFPGASNFHYAIQRHLQALRGQYPLDVVCRLTGMNKGEQALAIDQTNKTTYNWTIGQITRIAKARGLTFQQLMAEAIR